MNEGILVHSPEERRVAYVDMNAFFASVEQQEQPALRGKPVGVAPYLGRGSTIIAASYEARAYGVGVGTRVGRAMELCPALTVVRDSPSLYRDYHHRIMAILDDSLCQVGVRGIDEAYLVIPSYARNQSAILALVQGIKQTFREELGEHIKCSIGIGPNIWLAKMAAMSRKPDGLVALKLASLNDFYSGLALTDCTGIGRKMARQMYSVGISNASDLSHKSLSFLRSSFGLVGEKWYLRLRGYEVDANYGQSGQKSMSHQVTIVGERRLSTEDQRRYVISLAIKLGARLRRASLFAGGISLFVALTDSPGVYRLYPSGRSLSSDADIVHLATKLLAAAGIAGREVRLFALSLTDLSPIEQLTLSLESGSSARGGATLSGAIDLLSARFGGGIITRASLLKGEIVPDRIGFGR